MVRVLLPAIVILAALPAAARTPATGYVLARAADDAGDPARATAGYAAALAANPRDPVLADRLFRQALAAGEREPALAGARALAADTAAPSDARLLLIADAVRRRDWRSARAGLEAMPDGDLLAFLRPILSGWIALGEGRDPLAALTPGQGGAVALPYLAEHRALILLATGRRAEGLAALSTLSSDAGRSSRLRLIAAATLDRRADRAAALALLAGDGPVIARARARVEAGGRLAGAVDGPAAGIAVLLSRVAVDLDRERVTAFALSLARIATLIAPDSPEAWLIAAALLDAGGRQEAALAALARIPADDPRAATARDARGAILVRAGRAAEALAEAQAAAAAPGAGADAWTGIGDLQVQLGRPAEAAAAYARALATAEGARAAELWLLHGSALEQAGDWAAARPALEKAVALAPESSAALNYLGYAMLQHGGDLAAATRLIERASALAPNDAAITDSLGWAYFRQGRLAPAIATLEKAAAGEPGDSEINDHLGDAYWAAGRRVEARYAWTAALVYADAGARGRIQPKLDAGPAR